MGFQDDINKFVVKCKDNSNQVVRKTVLDIGTSLIQKSPVGNPELWASLGASYRIFSDSGKRIKPKLEFKRQPPPGYSGGHFRANWQIGIGSIPSGILDLKDKSGNVTINAIKGGIPKDAAGLMFFIANNLPYAQALEDGHSGQAPFGMVALTQVEFQNIINSAVKELQ
jgi:hypothetical protein